MHSLTLISSIVVGNYRYYYTWHETYGNTTVKNYLLRIFFDEICHRNNRGVNLFPRGNDLRWWEKEPKLAIVSQLDAIRVLDPAYPVRVVGGRPRRWVNCTRNRAVLIDLPVGVFDSFL